MGEQRKTVNQLRQELRELAVAIVHYDRQERFSEADQARLDYCGLLREVCGLMGFEPTEVYHPLLAGMGVPRAHKASIT